MNEQPMRLQAADLNGKIIDAHSHVGVSLGAYGRAEYPYAQTIEGLYFQQLYGKIDFNIVFPFSSDLYFNLPELVLGKYVKSHTPVSSVPFQVENLLLLKELFEYCPELSRRFIPFVQIDPLREPQAQVRELKKLLQTYPIYGIKVNPATSQMPLSALLKEGRCLMELAQEQSWPMLFHTSAIKTNSFSYADYAFKIAEAYPDLRFCLAHSLLFSKHFLDRALNTSNVWVDTAAFKIQVDLCRIKIEEGELQKRDLIEADFNNHAEVFAKLSSDYGEKIIWATDSPAYSYICKRIKQLSDQWQVFNYKSTYATEIELLRGLTPATQLQIAGRNTTRFLFGGL